MKSDLINSAVRKLELADIYLNESKLTRDIEFFRGSGFENLGQQRKQMVRVDTLVEDSEEKASENIVLRVVISFGVRLVDNVEGSAPDKAVLAEIEATFCALYKCSEMLSDAEIKEFAKHNAVHNVWPFWREHAYRVSAEANLPRPVIPLMTPRPRE